MQTVSEMWNFFQSEILGMAWLNRAIGHILGKAGVDTGSRMGASLQFFIYDVIKIMVLLGFLIFIISYIQSYFPPERTKKILGRFHGLGANAVAALLGTVTPFCSCSSIPIFMGFTGAGLLLLMHMRRQNRNCAGAGQIRHKQHKGAGHRMSVLPCPF